MGKVAFVFAGQGAQYSGMGKDLYENDPSAKAVFDKLDMIRPGTAAQCFTGESEELAQTGNTQPCMFAVELAAADALTDAGISCDMTAGFSLGEISALAFSGAVRLEDGFALACKRGALMQTESERAPSRMAAVVKLPAEEVEKICAQFEHVHPVNYNCPGQTSIAALQPELDDFCKAVKAAGGRAIPLKVRLGFHAPFLSGVSADFAEVLKGYNIKTPEIELYSNYTAQPYAGDYADLLAKQVCNPVRWQSIVENMIDSGVDTFVELGPGHTLCGLIGKINSNVRTFHVEDCASLEETVKGIKAC
ncbi:MAG: ACP S-malonyltransferase [Oscillospiraceae bacterium]